MAKSDLGYVNGLIASMYKTLIPRDKLMRLAEAEPEEIFRALKEQGYAGDARSSRDYQILLENETEKLLRFISDGDFGNEVEAYCLLKNDYHNLECTVRERYMGDLGNVFVPCGKFSLEQLKIAVLGRKTNITDGMKKATEKTCALYESGNASGRAISTIFISNYYAELTKLVKNKRLRDAVKFDIDAKNCSVAMRSGDFAQAQTMFIPGGTFSEKELEVLCSRDEHAIMLKFAYTPRYEYIRIAVEEVLRGEPMRAFEKAADNYALSGMDDVRYVSDGIIPVIMYYLYKNAEIKNVRTVMSLRLTGVNPDEIKQRLRKGYVG